MQPIDRLLIYNGLASGQGRLNTVCANDLSLGSMYVLTAVLALHSSAQIWRMSLEPNMQRGADAIKIR